MTKSDILRVPKAWGQEVVLVNNDLYCGKFLYFDKEAVSSLHLHEKKQETFILLHGEARLELEGSENVLEWMRPVTILPGQEHKVTAITDALILEISTPHSDDDVTRFTESTRGLV